MDSPREELNTLCMSILLGGDTLSSFSYYPSLHSQEDMQGEVTFTRNAKHLICIFSTVALGGRCSYFPLLSKSSEAQRDLVT